MTTFNKKNLLSELHDRLEVVRNNLQPFLRLTEEQLNLKPAPGKWSIAEVFEHLNIAYRLNLRAVGKKMANAPINSKTDFRSNWLGNLVYEKIIPRPDGSVFKMKAPKLLHAKSHELCGKKVLETFLKQLDEWDHVFELSYYVDLEKIKIPFSFTKLLKLRLGDNLRFIVAHSERHMLQAQRTMEVVCGV